MPERPPGRHWITLAREKRATEEDTDVGNIDWNHPRTWEEVCRRHAARRRWNAVKKVASSSFLVREGGGGGSRGIIRDYVP